VVGDDEPAHFFVPCVSAIGLLTERPHRRTLVCLEALDETDAVLLSRGFHSTGVEHLIVEADILKMFEVLVLVFDPKVAGVFRLSRSHVDASILDVVVVAPRESPVRRRAREKPR